MPTADCSEAASPLVGVAPEGREERDQTSGSAAGPAGLDHLPQAPRLNAIALWRLSGSRLKSCPQGQPQYGTYCLSAACTTAHACSRPPATGRRLSVRFRATVPQVGRPRACEDRQQLADVPLAGDRIGKGEMRVDGVVVAAPVSLVSRCAATTLLSIRTVVRSSAEMATDLSRRRLGELPQRKRCPYVPALPAGPEDPLSFVREAPGSDVVADPHAARAESGVGEVRHAVLAHALGVG